MWNSGSTPSSTSVGRSARPGCACDLLEVRPQVAVGEHRRLRRAGGAAGEDEHGEVVVGPLDDRRGSAPAATSSSAMAPSSPWPSVRDDVLEGRDEARSTPAKAGAAAGPDDDGSGTDGGQLPLELARRAQRVERHGDAAGAEDGAGTRRRSTSSCRRRCRHGRRARAPGRPSPPGTPPTCSRRVAVGRGPTPADEGDGVVRMGFDDRGEVHLGERAPFKVGAGGVDVGGRTDEQATPGKPGCTQSHGPTAGNTSPRSARSPTPEEPVAMRRIAAALVAAVVVVARARDHERGPGRRCRRRRRGPVRGRRQRHPRQQRPAAARRSTAS